MEPYTKMQIIHSSQEILYPSKNKVSRYFHRKHSFRCSIKTYLGQFAAHKYPLIYYQHFDCYKEQSFHLLLVEPTYVRKDLLIEMSRLIFLLMECLKCELDSPCTMRYVEHHITRAIQNGCARHVKRNYVNTYITWNTTRTLYST